MNYFVYNYNHDEQELFTKIARYHIEFERIHLFEDRNGRDFANWLKESSLNEKERIKKFGYEVLYSEKMKMRKK